MFMICWLQGPTYKRSTKLKMKLPKEFEMQDLGVAKIILGISTIRDKDSGILKLLLENYIQNVLKQFNMVNENARSTPLGGPPKTLEESIPKK